MRDLGARGVRGYVTLNTLIFESELEALEAAVRACAAAGVDAVIVQDLGVARLARAIAPSCQIHRLDADDVLRRVRRAPRAVAGALRVTILPRECVAPQYGASPARLPMGL